GTGPGQVAEEGIDREHGGDVAGYPGREVVPHDMQDLEDHTAGGGDGDQLPVPLVTPQRPRPERQRDHEQHDGGELDDARGVEGREEGGRGSRRDRRWGGRGGDVWAGATGGGRGGGRRGEEGEGQA